MVAVLRFSIVTTCET